MKLKLIFSVAKSLLLARWKQTLIAAIGVTFSIAMFITLLGFMSGLNHLLDGLVINRTPHILLYREIKASASQPIEQLRSGDSQYDFISSIRPKNETPDIRNSGAIMENLSQDPRVMGIAPKLNMPVFYNIGTIELAGTISGIEIEAENKLFHFKDYVTYGNYRDLNNIPNSIIMGKSAADQMLIHMGDIIQVTTIKGQQMLLKVVGFFQSGLKDIDRVQSFTSLVTAQKLLGVPQSYLTDIQIKLFDLNMAPAVAREYAVKFETDAVDIQDANSQFDTGTKIRTIISYAVGITLLIVSGFGIYNILNMMIYEKMDSIAILKATGFSGKDVKAIFMTIAQSIGLFGGFFGLLFGLIFCLGIDRLPFKTEALPTVDTYPVDYNPAFYIIGIIFSVVTTFFAGFFPARKAGKVDPVTIIRGK